MTQVGKRRPRLDDLVAIFALESVKGFGPQKFKTLHQASITPAQVLEVPSTLPLKGKRATELQAAIKDLSAEDLARAAQRAASQLERADACNADVLIYGDSRYPKNVFASNNPVPVLYARGNLDLLGSGQAVACVGSRAISPPYNRLHEQFARVAIAEGFSIVSGFAMGADSIGHRAALDTSGPTVCVMPSGLDRPFPPENAGLWEELLSFPSAVIVSEFPFGRGADSLTLRKRNKLIVAFSLGVLVSQSSRTGGAMNAYRFAVEQRKPVATFEPDGSDQSSGNLQIRDDQKADTTVLDDDQGSWRRWLARLSL